LEANTDCRVFRLGHERTADLNADLTVKKYASEAFDAVVPDVIINLAALTDVDRCESDVNRAYLLNTRIVENIVDWVSTRQSIRLIHLSTDQLYDGVGPQAEGAVVIRNAYALSKYASEIFANSVNACVLRTNFFGRSAAPGRSSFSDWALSNLSAGKSIMGFTDIQFSPLRLATVCRLIGLVIERFHPGVYNLGSHRGMSKAEFLHLLASTFQKDVRLIEPTLSDRTDLKARRPRDMRMDVSLFEQTFGARLPELVAEVEALRIEYEL